jgi:hypothetical protein
LQQTQDGEKHFYAPWTNSAEYRYSKGFRHKNRWVYGNMMPSPNI